MVAGARHGVARARHFPAPEVLGADGEAEGLGGGGGALFEVGSAFLRVVDFVGHLGAVDGDFVWVFGVGCVDGG